MTLQAVNRTESFLSDLAHYSVVQVDLCAQAPKRVLILLREYFLIRITATFFPNPIIHRRVCSDLKPSAYLFVKFTPMVDSGGHGKLAEIVTAPS
jgi:hypothetical protein